jgi:hypothetical protein
MSVATATPAGLDPALPTMPLALDAAVAGPALAATLAAPGDDFELHGLRLVRHKLGRRFLVEYDVELGRRGGAAERFAVIAKVRRHRTGERGLELARALWDAGFDDRAGDGIAIPEPLGHVPVLHAWLQRKAPGVPLTDMLGDGERPARMPRVAAAARKVHRAGVAPRRAHTMADEVAILHERLGALAAARPRLARRLERVLAACDRIGAATPEPVACGIHRDFYGDQVLVDGDRLWLLDFDLYCEGDPAVDAGNFIGHLTEQALRELGDPEALRDHERAFEDAFAASAGEACRPAVRAYALLTLVRHIELSTRLEDRAHVTPELLELCEERLDIASRRAS